jgi:hypothetical protein
MGPALVVLVVDKEEELCDFYASANVLKVVKSRKLP